MTKKDLIQIEKELSLYRNNISWRDEIKELINNVFIN
jgi:hypothetical protein